MIEDIAVFDEAVDEGFVESGFLGGDIEDGDRVGFFPEVVKHAFDEIVDFYAGAFLPGALKVPFFPGRRGQGQGEDFLSFFLITHNR